jgi:aspartate aminotransferase
MAALAEVLQRHSQVALMTDDIYEHIRFDGGETACPVAIAPALRSRTLLVNGVSKTYAMTGFRIGYGAGSEALITAINVIQSQTTSGAASMCMAAAAAALEGDQGFVAKARDAYRERRDRAVQLLDAIEGMSCRSPDGAFYVYPSCAGLIGRRRGDGRRLESDLDVALYFLEEAGVAVLDGSAYGLSPYLRMSIATSLTAIEDACGRMKHASETLQ